MIASALVGCASVPPQSEPELELDTQTSAAVGSAPFWRWLGRAVLQLVKNTNVVVRVDAPTQEPEAVRK